MSRVTVVGWIWINQRGRVPQYVVQGAGGPEASTHPQNVLIHGSLMAAMQWHERNGADYPEREGWQWREMYLRQ